MTGTLTEPAQRPTVGSTASDRRARDEIFACLGIDARTLRNITRDLYRHRMAVYGCDLVCSVVVGYGAFIAFPIDAPFSPLALLLFAVSTLGCYRALLFIHELAHMPYRRFLWFRAAWDALCGIPLLVPSFFYETHREHHAAGSYGTASDGEYLPYARLPWTSALGLLAASVLAGPALVIRFAVLAPLGWVIPRLRAWVLRRASALVVDPSHRRRLPSGTLPRHWIVQEALRFIWCAAVLFGLIAGALSLSKLVEAYAVFTAVLLVNGVRTLAAHRYRLAGESVGLAKQVLDSNNFPRWWSEPWAPLGLRYHSVHHLLPSLPYHALPEAHRRLMACVPERSAFRSTNRRSLAEALSLVLRSQQRLTAQGESAGLPS
jgi:fatty acid desaturase